MRFPSGEIATFGRPEPVLRLIGATPLPPCGSEMESRTTASGAGRDVSFQIAAIAINDATTAMAATDAILRTGVMDGGLLSRIHRNCSATSYADSHRSSGCLLRHLLMTCSS